MSDFWDFMRFMAAVMVGVVAFVAVIVVGIRYAGHHVDTGACHTFGVQTERTVKFVDYSWWTWDCLTPAHDGKWISVENLREVAR